MEQKNAAPKTMLTGGASFLIRIQFRQNASWQGTIQWLEEKKTMRFRSVLEMLSLMQEAVEKSGPSEGLPLFFSWESKEEAS